MNVAYINIATGMVHTMLSAPGLDGMPEPSSGDLAVMTEYSGGLPAYWDGSAVRAVPEQPSKSHVWGHFSKAWLLSLDAAKATKWQAVKATRDAREFGPFSWGGHAFDGDRDAQRRLTVALEAAKEAIAAGATFSTFWKLADNTIVTLSAQDVVDVYRACGEHNIRDNHAAAAVKYAQIQAATTLEQLDAITVD